ncbi:MAG: 16S rRNA (uracil(1498)-N(3))-methyltransferase [Muribaculaceae bacterium]|nr:16S rRNA (uracil(1498)-N(3))-methyltransferase [Muribaculaceae bacterium]
MIQFFSPDILTTGTLTPEDSRHCSKVLRHRAGDEISVIDGSGRRYRCRILDPDPRCTQVEIIDAETIPPHWGVDITLAVAPTKNMDRMEWMVEKSVEIGVNRIVPLLCEHSERKVVKPERLVNIAVSAMKQSLKTTLPEVAPLSRYGDFIKSTHQRLGENPSLQCFMGYCDKNYPLLRLADEYHAGSDVVIMIGPEGDFSPEEVNKAVECGFRPVTFGNSRLRTETAAISALDTIHILNMIADSRQTK